MGLYNKQYFQKRRRYTKDYATIAQWLVQNLKCREMLDLGCGQGLLMEHMAALGVEVRGMEVAEAAKKEAAETIRNRIEIASFLDHSPQCSFVVCLEVLEHIESRLIPRAIDQIAQATTKTLLFSAASPYQPGTGHVFCRGQLFWIDELEDRGLVLDRTATRAWRNDTAGLDATPWLHHNAMIFRR